MIRTRRFWIGVALIAVTLFLAFRGIEFDKLLTALTRFNPIYLLPAVLFFWFSFGSRVFRWQLLFVPYRIRWNKVLANLSIGYFLSNVTPFRFGDVARAYLLAASEKVPLARSLSTIVVERVSDALTIVLFLVVLLPIIPNLPEEARWSAAVVGAAGLAIFAVLAVLSLKREQGTRVLKRIASPIQFLQRDSIWRALDHLIDGFAVLHSIRPVFGLAAWSIIIWLFAGILNWTVMQAMGIKLGLDAAALVLVATSLSVTFLPTPGQFGSFHAAAVAALTFVYHVDKEEALAFALVIHAYVYIWLMVLGTIFMGREGLSFGQLRAVERQAESA